MGAPAERSSSLVWDLLQWEKGTSCSLFAEETHQCKGARPSQTQVPRGVRYLKSFSRIFVHCGGAEPRLRCPIPFMHSGPSFWEPLTQPHSSPGSSRATAQSQGRALSPTWRDAGGEGRSLALSSVRVPAKDWGCILKLALSWSEILLILAEKID